MIFSMTRSTHGRRMAASASPLCLCTCALNSGVEGLHLGVDWAALCVLYCQHALGKLTCDGHDRVWRTFPLQKVNITV